MRDALFDLDGTLAATEDLHYASVNRVLRDFGVALPPGERFAYVGTGERGFWSRVVARFDLPLDVEACIRRRCELGAPLFRGAIRPFPGIPEGLAWLRGEGVRLGLVSSTPRPLIETILRACGLEDRFDVVVSGMDPGILREKPHPDAYLHAIDRLGGSPRTSLVFEDSEPGIAAAKAAGCRCVAIQDGARRAGHDLSAADRVFPDPRACFAFLRGHASRESAGAAREVRVLEDGEALAREAAAEVVRCAREGIASRGIFTVALAGGSTPRRLYRLLATDPAWRDRVDWTRTEVFFGDERAAGPEDPESNYRMARESLLAPAGVPAARVHRIRGELAREDRAGGSPAGKGPSAAALAGAEEAARRAEAEMREALHVPSGIPRLDLVLLGMGEDGHTASLFPGSPALGERSRLWVANPVSLAASLAGDEPAARRSRRAMRITMTYPLLEAARCVAFLVQGASKARRVAQVLRAIDGGGIAGTIRVPEAAGTAGTAEAAGAPGDEPPAARVRPAEGRLLWLLDRAAAAVWIRDRDSA